VVDQSPFSARQSSGIIESINSAGRFDTGIAYPSSESEGARNIRAMRSGVAPEVLVRIRLVCLDLPEVTEEIAWTGVRWCVGRKNFAHVLTIAEGWPPAYAKAASISGPACVLTFRLSLQHCPQRAFGTRRSFVRRGLRISQVSSSDLRPTG
jgi:hypothetical protein